MFRPWWRSPGGLLATLIVNTLDMPQDGFPEPAPAHYDDENEEQRLARRRLRWTPAAMVPAARASLTAQTSDFRESYPCRSTTLQSWTD